jgi:hypothetical protein
VTKTKSSIYLVYSSEKSNNTLESESHDVSEDKWGQLDLFVSEKPDTVIVAQPEALGFTGIYNIIHSGHARRIFDLREVPFISFDDESRESFLHILKINNVEYFNIFNLKSKFNSTDKNINSTEIIESFFTGHNVTEIIKPMIESGPTIVFSDLVPSHDKAVENLLNLLSKSEITYSTVYAEA